MHLLCELRENFRYLHSRHRCFDWIELALHLAARFRIPRVEVAHAAAVPEKDDVFCVALAGNGLCHQSTDRHAEHRRTE